MPEITTGVFVNEPAEATRILGEDIHYLQDSEVTIDGLRFWGAPWQPEFNEWAFNLPRGAPLAEKWALIPDGIDVLLTHGPPLSIGDRSGDDTRLGCEDLLHAVRRVRPLLHVFGHIHQDGGCWNLNDTTIVNATTWECERGRNHHRYRPSQPSGHTDLRPSCTQVCHGVTLLAWRFAWAKYYTLRTLS